MHRYWLIKHLTTRINSSGLQWGGALLPFNAGPLHPCPLISLSLASLCSLHFGVYLLGAILPALGQICTNLATRFRFCGNLNK